MEAKILLVLSEKVKSYLPGEESNCQFVDTTTSVYDISAQLNQIQA